MLTELFTSALGRQSPWQVAKVRFTHKQGRIDFVDLEIRTYVMTSTSNNQNAMGLKNRWHFNIPLRIPAQTGHQFLLKPVRRFRTISLGLIG